MKTIVRVLLLICFCIQFVNANPLKQYEFPPLETETQTQTPQYPPSESSSYYQPRAYRFPEPEKEEPRFLSDRAKRPAIDSYPFRSKYPQDYRYYQSPYASSYLYNNYGFSPYRYNPYLLDSFTSPWSFSPFGNSLNHGLFGNSIWNPFSTQSGFFNPSWFSTTPFIDHPGIRRPGFFSGIQ